VLTSAQHQQTTNQEKRSGSGAYKREKLRMDAVTPPDNTVTTACGKTTAKRWGVASVVHHARNLALTTTLRASKDVWNAANAWIAGAFKVSVSELQSFDTAKTIRSRVTM
jgi:hypothetical protein